MRSLRDHSISDTYDKDQRNISTPETTIHKHDRLVKGPETTIPKYDTLATDTAPETTIPKHDRLVKGPETKIPKYDTLATDTAPETTIPKHDRLVKGPETKIPKYDTLATDTGDVDILIIHLERTNEIIEVLKFKDHLKNLVTEMGYNNISIKLLEEEFHQEDGKDTVKLNDLFAKCGYIFVYISKNSVPTRLKRIELAESSFQYAIEHPQEYPLIKTVCDCEDWLYLEGYPKYLNYYKYKLSIDLEEYKSKLSSLLETM